MKLYQYIAGAAALVLTVGQSLAADLPSTKSAPIFDSHPVYSWTGFYVGANAGAAIGDSTFGPAKAALNGSAFLGGAQVGYNWQASNNFVLGLEADADYRGPIGGSSLVSSTRDGYFGTARARLGYAWDRLLVYGTGGLAFSNSIAPKTFAGAGLVAPGFETGVRINNNDTFLLGYAVGGGIEYAFTDRWSVKAEYLYSGLSRSHPLYATSAAATNLPVSTNSALSAVRIGLNYHFGAPPLPVLAKY